jgi:hypothetical protein
MRSSAVLALVAVLAACCLSSVSADLPPNTVQFDGILVTVCAIDSKEKVNCVPKPFDTSANTGCYNGLQSANYSVGFSFTNLDDDNQVTYTESLFAGLTCQGDALSSSAPATFSVDNTMIGLQNYTVDTTALPLVGLSNIFNYTVSSMLFATVLPPAGTIEFESAIERICPTDAHMDCYHVEIPQPLADACTNLSNTTYSSRVTIQPVVNNSIIVWAVAMYSVPNCNESFMYPLPGFPPTVTVTFDALTYGETYALSPIFKLTKADGSPILPKGDFNAQLNISVNVIAPEAPSDGSSNGLIGLPSFLMGLGLLLSAGLIYAVCLRKKVEHADGGAPSTSYHSMA